MRYHIGTRTPCRSLHQPPTLRSPDLQQDHARELPEKRTHITQWARVDPPYGQTAKARRIQGYNEKRSWWGFSG